MRTAVGWKKRWDDDELLDELATVLAEQDRWPSQQAFEALGRLDLYAAVKRRGGIDRWAARLNLPLRPAQIHRSNPYTAEDAEREARKLMAEHGYLPGARKLRAMGYGRLAGHVNWHHRSSTAYVRAQGWGDNERPPNPR